MTTGTVQWNPALTLLTALCKHRRPSHLEWVLICQLRDVFFMSQPSPPQKSQKSSGFETIKYHRGAPSLALSQSFWCSRNNLSFHFIFCRSPPAPSRPSHISISLQPQCLCRRQAITAVCNSFLRMENLTMTRWRGILDQKKPPNLFEVV